MTRLRDVQMEIHPCLRTSSVDTNNNGYRLPRVNVSRGSSRVVETMAEGLPKTEAFPQRRNQHLVGQIQSAPMKRPLQIEWQKKAGKYLR